MPRSRTVLRADALVCFAFGLIFFVFAAPLGSVLARGPPEVSGVELARALRLLGAGVLAVGVGVTRVAATDPIRPAAVLPILAVEVVWLAACAAIPVWARDHLTPLGLTVVAASAAAVLAFLVLEVAGLRPRDRGG